MKVYPAPGTLAVRLGFDKRLHAAHVCQKRTWTPSVRSTLRRMTLDSRMPASGNVNKRLLAAGVGLAVVGGVLGCAGMAAVGATVFGATRRRIAQTDMSPRDLAALRLQQAKRATLAGARAWREEGEPNDNGKRIRGMSGLAARIG